MKKNRAVRWGWTLAWGLVGFWAHAAHAADPRLLVVESPGTHNGFLNALRIQLIGLAEPERVVQPLAASPSAQIEAGTALARSQHALASVWLDPPLNRPSGVVLLYVVGEREGRALVEVVRVPGERGPALERTLALKVREVVTELLRSPSSAPSAPTAEQLKAPTPASPQPEPQQQTPPTVAASPAPDSQPSAAAWSGQFGLGPRLGSQPLLGLAHWGVGVGAGPAYASQSFRVAGVLSADWFPARTAEFDLGRVRYWEIDAALTVQAQHRIGPVWVGVRAGPQLIYLDASGETVLGVTGKPFSGVIWGLAFGMDVELPLSATLALGIDLQLQTLVDRQHFEVNERELVDTGQLRFRSGLSLVLRL